MKPILLNIKPFKHKAFNGKEKKNLKCEKIETFLAQKVKQCNNFTLDIEAKRTCERSPSTKSGAMRSCERKKKVWKI